MNTLNNCPPLDPALRDDLTEIGEKHGLTPQQIAGMLEVVRASFGGWTFVPDPLDRAQRCRCIVVKAEAADPWGVREKAAASEQVLALLHDRYGTDKDGWMKAQDALVHALTALVGVSGARIALGGN